MGRALGRFCRFFPALRCCSVAVAVFAFRHRHICPRLIQCPEPAKQLRLPRHRPYRRTDQISCAKMGCSALHLAACNSLWSCKARELWPSCWAPRRGGALLRRPTESRISGKREPNKSPRSCTAYSAYQIAEPFGTSCRGSVPLALHMQQC